MWSKLIMRYVVGGSKLAMIIVRWLWTKIGLVMRYMVSGYEWYLLWDVVIDMWCWLWSKWYDYESKHIGYVIWLRDMWLVVMSKVIWLWVKECKLWDVIMRYMSSGYEICDVSYD